MRPLRAARKVVHAFEGEVAEPTTTSLSDSATGSSAARDQLAYWITPTFLPRNGPVLPIERWMREGLCKHVEATLLDASRGRDLGLDPEAVGALGRDVSAVRPGFYFTRMWAPFVLLEWARQHDVRL